MLSKVDAFKFKKSLNFQKLTLSNFESNAFSKVKVFGLELAF
jgi:hypothetical protein